MDSTKLTQQPPKGLRQFHVHHFGIHEAVFECIVRLGPKKRIKANVVFSRGQGRTWDGLVLINCCVQRLHDDAEGWDDGPYFNAGGLPFSEGLEAIRGGFARFEMSSKHIVMAALRNDTRGVHDEEAPP